MFELELPEPFGDGESGARLFRVRAEDGSPAVMKCASGPRAGDLADEARRLDWLRKRTSVPRVLSLGRAHDSCWFTMTLLAGTPGHELAAAARPKAVVELASALRRMHAQAAPNCPFDQRIEAQLARAEQNTRDGWVDESDFDASRRGRTAVDLLAQLQRERPAVEEPVLTHGDCCLPNVLFLDDGSLSGFVDCPRAGLADRHQDLALAIRSLRFNWGEAYVAMFVDAYGRDAVDERRLAWYELLDEFF